MQNLTKNISYYISVITVLAIAFGAAGLLSYTHHIPFLIAIMTLFLTSIVSVIFAIAFANILNGRRN